MEVTFIGMGLSLPGVLRARGPFLLRLHSRTKPTMTRMIKTRALRANTASMAGRYLESWSIVLATSVDNVTVVDPEPSFETL